ncbi:hypothetical protein J1P26_07250 [Neobacillus sp. MM2021_6]|uniref:YqaI family protein n=1 Tax=Bacillaceae TaxID=186817 RepID=UPI001409D4B4|nr:MULTISPECIES: hypothetical protein [Bacillaceae]MBO0959528.1 hypothetical protein [Neobacillus sp. MM2021_6]NHC17174.1 hypothetical protein [Bacillus sp. MM2020_4]
MEHPIISEINRTGYPRELSGVENVVTQPECNGIDVFGDEILEGDSVVFDQDNGEVILTENLERYLLEYCNFKFTTAE